MDPIKNMVEAKGVPKDGNNLYAQCKDTALNETIQSLYIFKGIILKTK